MIQAKIVADSICPRGNRLTTLEVIMPRYILAEFNTHRMLSRNSASSRAIPFVKMIKEVQERPFIPYAWQMQHSGMQGNEYIQSLDMIKWNEEIWLKARDKAIEDSTELTECDVTKQLANRLLEPFMYHKVLVSGTEWENFFNLRCPQYQSGYKVGSSEEKNYKIHKSWKDLYTNFVLDGVDSKICQNIKEKSILEKLQTNKGQADIHMMFLAESIYDAMNESIPVKRKEGEWHIPYGDKIELSSMILICIEKGLLPMYKNLDDYTEKEIEVTMELVRKISVARCARLSYQTLGDNPEINYEKDLELYEVLAKSGHYSPFEHVAKVMTNSEYKDFIKGEITSVADEKFQQDMLEYSDGKTFVTGILKDDKLGWCLNFKGFIQKRYLLEQSWKG